MIHHQPNTQCAYCHTLLYRFPRDLKRTSKSYCNRWCRAAYEKAEPNCICEECGEPFYRAPKHVSRVKRNFCSDKCSRISRKRANNTFCYNCEKPISRKPSSLERFERHYCSMECRSHSVNRMFNKDREMNTLEQDFLNTFPMLKFIGNGELWIQDELGKMNPDFILPGTHKIIELYGNYWHRGENPQERINRLQSCGYHCLIIWENDFRKHVVKVQKQVNIFIGLKP